jgi:hypothetical protein
MKENKKKKILKARRNNRFLAKIPTKIKTNNHRLHQIWNKDLILDLSRVFSVILKTYLNIFYKNNILRIIKTKRMETTQIQKKR